MMDRLDSVGCGVMRHGTILLQTVPDREFREAISRQSLKKLCSPPTFFLRDAIDAPCSPGYRLQALEGDRAAA